MTPTWIKHEAICLAIAVLDAMAAQAEAFVAQARAEGLPVARLMRDRDSASSKAFDQVLRRRRVKVLKSSFQAPNMNAFAERFVQSIRQECLDHFIVFGTQHLDVLYREYLAHYHTARPHQGLDNELIVKPKVRRQATSEEDIPPLSAIRCRTRLGGLLKHYERRAA